MNTLIGIISDTHGLIRDEALRELAGSDLIIHAGDVGNRAVLDALGRIAPVHAVRGNVDKGEWAEVLPPTTTVAVGNVRIFVIHNLADLDTGAAARGFAAVIYGHSHKPAHELRDGVLYLNPGSAGPRRFRLPPTVARMTVAGGSLEAGIVPLEITP